MDPKREVHKSVQQILYNELGLNKGNINKLVNDTVERIIKNRVEAILGSGGDILDLVDRVISHRIERYAFGKPRASTPMQLKALVEKSIAECVTKFVKEQVENGLKIDIDVSTRKNPDYGAFS